MIQVKTRFDGQQLIVPDELRGRAPMDVTIVIADIPEATQSGSWHELVGKSSKPMTPEEIDAYLAEIRADWDEHDHHA